jgi:hypothetical protein
MPLKEKIPPGNSEEGLETCFFYPENHTFPSKINAFDE